MIDTPIELSTGQTSEYSVIWLHGLGADGADFVPVIPELGLNSNHRIRFIFPHAPYRRVTCNGGYEMRAWYDIISLEPKSREIDVAGLLESRTYIRELIAKEVQRGVPSRKIILAGFSQGGAVAYLTALTHPEELGGVIALSTYIPSPELLLDEAAPGNRHIPILAAHGDEDDVVSLQLGLMAKECLAGAGYTIEWLTYPMPHSICIEEIQAIGAWLQSRMSQH